MNPLHSSKLRVGAALAVLGALAACAQAGVMVSRVDYAYQYEPLEISAAGNLPVTVLGNPFDAPQAELERSIVDSMQGRTFGVPVNFSVASGERDPDQRFHVVVAFAPSSGGDPGALCKGGNAVQTAGAGSSTTTLMGAFCSNDSYLSHAIARRGGVEGPGSEQLDSLVAQLTLSLFPDENPNRQVDGDTGPPLS